MLASRWKTLLDKPGRHVSIAIVYLLAWTEALALYYMSLLPLPAGKDPMGRAAGWRETAVQLGTLQREEEAPILIADSYKEASIFSFHLPDHEFIYTKRHWPAATQYDFWPGYLDVPHARALWITADATPDALARDFSSIHLVERVQVSYRGRPLRRYSIYRCETR